MAQRRFFRAVLVLSAFAGFLPGNGGAAEPGAGTPSFKPCRLEHPAGLTSVEAQCTQVVVPENPSAPQGRQLTLFVARIPALSRQAAPEPLFVLAGGPGLGASTFYTGMAPAFAQARRRHDIILVDQRGTGRSHPLKCEFEEQQMWDAGEAETARVMRACRTQLEKDHDLAQYTTSVAVRDLEAVRSALGYGRISLYGSSYGTRVAQHYARRYPQHTLALVLDGVVPPARILGPTTPLDAQEVLERIFERCRNDQSCTARFVDPGQDYVQLRERLDRQPVELTLPDPRTGQPRQLLFGDSALAGALRLATYSSEQAALLPLSLHLANRQQLLAPLAGQFLLSASAYESVLAFGMHNSVVCTEDVPFFPPTPAGLESTFLGSAQLDALQALCADWPRGPMDADFHEPLDSPVPALLLSGTADPVTPARFGDEAALGFRHALHLKLPDQGHGQIVLPCIDGIVAEFLDLARTSERPSPDSRCAERLRPAPFFLTMGGPAP